MNEHAGLGSLLSVLIVVGFSLILHEAERTLRVAGGPPSVVARVDSIAAESSRPDVHKASIIAPPPVLAEAPLFSSPIAQPVRTDRIALNPASSRANRPLLGPKPSVQAVSERSLAFHPTMAPPPPLASPRPLPTPDVVRSTVTVAEPGERLVDVAIRIYGSAAAVEKLWRANRDRLANRGSPLIDGWLLRTP